MMISWPFLARDAKFSPDFPHTVTSTKVVTCWRSPWPSLKNSLFAIVAVATAVPSLVSLKDWVSNQVTSDDDVIDVHSNMRVFFSRLVKWSSSFRL